jgi:hypothetical protein
VVTPYALAFIWLTLMLLIGGEINSEVENVIGLRITHQDHFNYFATFVSGRASSSAFSRTTEIRCELIAC